MNFLEGLLMILLLPLAMASAGFWLVAPLTSLDAGRRLALALLAGLGVLLLAVSWVNLFLPLSGWGAALAGAPIVVPLLFPPVRRRLLRDLVAALRGAGAWLLGAGIAAHLALLLWPLLADSSIVYFDGTSNHDSFFWISGAEYLKRHDYLTLLAFDGERPFYNSAAAILTLEPTWGRMGSEGLLALLSSLAGASPVKVYFYATAALLFPWIGACYLLIRTFLKEQLHGIALLSLGLLQPIFAFFHSNSNLPNLVGVLSGALLVFGTVHALRRRPAEPGWPPVVWCALGLHGLICSYPEMLPFVLLPCGLLWLRGSGGAVDWTWRGRAMVLAGLGLGIILNPFTIIRGYHGFLISFSAARANESWGNLFERLLPAEYLPALTSLVVGACGQLGTIGGSLISALLAFALIHALRKARDGIGISCVLSGSFLLLLYTLATDFVYGWQKTVQFGGPAIAAIFPTGILALLPLDRRGLAAWRTRRLAIATAAVLVGFYGFTTVWGLVRTHYWADYKAIVREHLELREFSYAHLADAHVLVVPETFGMPFFHGMWASYALPVSDLVFSPRSEEAGGYLRNFVHEYQPGEMPAPDAAFVSREWADSVDANSPRLFAGRRLALLRQSNHVLSWTGVDPPRGLPHQVAETMGLEIRPHSDGFLTAEFEARDTGNGRPAQVAQVETTVVLDGISRSDTFEGTAPWRIRLPLAGGVPNKIIVRISPVGRGWDAEYPLLLRSIRVHSGLPERASSAPD